MAQCLLLGPLPARWTTLSYTTRLQTLVISTLVLVIVLVDVYPNVLVDVVAVSVGRLADGLRPA